jgi:hypothetical protein
MAFRLAPVMRELSSGGHSVTLVHDPRIDAGLLVAAMGTAHAVPFRKDSHPSGELPAPWQERSSAAVRGALRSLAGRIAGTPPPAGRRPPLSLAELSGAEYSGHPARSSVVNQCLALGADVVLGMVPTSGLDVLVLAETCEAGAGLQSVRTAGSVLALGRPCWRSVKRLAACQGLAEALLAPDPATFHPGLAAGGLALRERLGIQPDEMVVLAVPPAVGGGGLAASVRAFAAMSEHAARMREKLRLLMPADGGRDSRLAGAEIQRHNLQGRTLSVRALPPSASPVEGGQPHAAPWNLMCAAANVGLALSDDPNGMTVLEAVACGCPVVALSSNAAAGLLLPGACGEAIAANATPEAAAVAAASLLATERAQRSRQFVAMAGHFPSVAATASLLGDLLVAAMERKILALSGVSADGDPMTALVAAGRRHAADPAHVVASAHPEAIWKPAAAPPADRWITLATAVSVAPEFEAKNLIRQAGMDVPGGVWVPDPDQIIRQDNDTLNASWRLPTGATRERLFAPPRPTLLHSRVWFHDASAGERAFETMRHAAANGISCAPAIAGGSDGRRSFLVVAGAPGVGVPEFLRSCASPDTDAGRIMRHSVFLALGRLMADLHRLGITAGKPEATGIHASIGPNAGLRVTFGWLADATMHDAGVTTMEAMRDLAWLAHSLTGGRLFRRHGQRHSESGEARDDPAHKPSAAAPLDVARAIGAKHYAAASEAAHKPANDRPRTNWHSDPEGITRTTLMWALRAYAARRGLAGEAPVLLARLAQVFPQVARQRTEWLDRQQAASNALARDRVARGELVPVTASDI